MKCPLLGMLINWQVLFWFEYMSWNCSMHKTRGGLFSDYANFTELHRLRAETHLNQHSHLKWWWFWNYLFVKGTYECFILKELSITFLDGGKISLLPTVFLTPNKSRIPLLPKIWKNCILFYCICMFL